MGCFTVYDILIGNPCEIYNHDDYNENNNNEDSDNESNSNNDNFDDNFDDKYNWQTNIIVITRKGKIKKNGHYDSYGRVEFNNNGLNEKYEVYIENHNKDNYDGIILTKTTYKYLRKNKRFNEIFNNSNEYNLNLFDLLIKYSNQNIYDDINKFFGAQFLGITCNLNNNYHHNGIVNEHVDGWMFINPKGKFNNNINNIKKVYNKKRIKRIINNFLNWCDIQIISNMI